MYIHAHTSNLPKYIQGVNERLNQNEMAYSGGHPM